jgi:hypothetical protein
MILRTRYDWSVVKDLIGLDMRHDSPAAAQHRSAQDWGQGHADCQAGDSSGSQIASPAALIFLGMWTRLESLSV